MRLLFRIGLFAVLLGGLAAPAFSLSLLPEPGVIAFAEAERAGEIRIVMVDDGLLGFEVALDRGRLRRIDVQVVDASGSLVRLPLDAGQDGGFVKRVKLKTTGRVPRVEFRLKRFQVPRRGSDGLETALLFVEYEDLAIGDQLLFTLRGGGPTGAFASTIVPEPGTLFLLSLGLGGLALSARRRRL